MACLYIFCNFAAKFEPMSRNEQELKGVTLLGNQNTQYSYDYTPEVLETFENKHPETTSTTPATTP